VFFSMNGLEAAYTLGRAGGSYAGAGVQSSGRLDRQEDS
jgi:hypothetical protein